MNKSVKLNNPWILDITEKFTKQLSQFDGSVEKLTEFYKQFGYDKIPYSGEKRWGLDSSTDTSDIKYDDISENSELWWRRYTNTGFRWTLIRITHKYNGIIFFETVGLKKKISTYIDTGANDLQWYSQNKSRYTLPKHEFYPIKIIKPEWVDITGWNAPKDMIITNIK